MKQGVILTGHPASGKSTLGRDLAACLSFAFLDKDDFLEGLYATHDVQDWDDRKALSRQSDALFRAAAEASGSAVLVTHWRPPAVTEPGGTPTDWLSATFDHLIEVHCQCSVQTAAARFLARNRHPDHLDHLRDPAGLERQMTAWQHAYPLGLGPVIEVDTETRPDVERTAAAVSAHLG